MLLINVGAKLPLWLLKYCCCCCYIDIVTNVVATLMLLLYWFFATLMLLLYWCFCYIDVVAILMLLLYWCCCYIDVVAVESWPHFLTSSSSSLKSDGQTSFIIRREYLASVTSRVVRFNDAWHLLMSTNGRTPPPSNDGAKSDLSFNLILAVLWFRGRWPYP